MFRPVKVIDIELSQPLTSIEGLERYETVKALVRLHGSPLGYVSLPIHNGRCLATVMSQAVLDQLNWPILQHLLDDGLAAPPPGGLHIDDLVKAPHATFGGPFPLVTVAICTRDRAADLALCLEALTRLDYPALDLLVVDNAPTTEATEQLVRTRYPQARYVCEPRPGLDWARNRAILEARGEIIAYTDDDVVVDAGWVKAIAQVFVENPAVMAVTGLVAPYELETEAQILFEQYGGFGRGFQRREVTINPNDRERWRYYGTGQFGTGANMAYRRSVFAQLGLFDPALDVGTVTNGGGDLEMYFRVLAEGHTLVYEPNAIVRHRHRREYAQLRRQISCNGNGLYAYFVRSFLAYPRERLPLLWLMIWWLGWWHIRRLAVSFIRPTRFPRDLVWAELRNSLVGLGRYQQARRIAAQIADRFGPQPAAPAAPAPQPAPAPNRRPGAVAVRILDLSRPVPALPDVTPYAVVRVFATWQGQLLGQVEVANRYHPLSASRLRQAMVNFLNFKLLETQGGPKDGAAWAKAMAAVIRHYATPESEGEAPGMLPSHTPVSVVVGTHDRPDDLRECLRALTAQITARPVEIIVVDNNPTSGRTPAVVAEFPRVRLVNEARKGVAYARNAGIHASHGEIIVSVDDDVTMPPSWLENLVAPFARQDVMAVTGNVIPHELETEAQRLFEVYGGLGRGFKMFEVGGDWFESYRLRMPPTWTLGGTANAAFRASIFNNPDIGLMDEALGPGMPSGVGEDIYLFYRILKANCTHIYQPTAYIYHKHRRNPEALRRQIYNYSKGFVSYHLTTLLRDHDLRSLVQLGLELPKAHLWRIKERWRGRSSYPVSFILLEILGNLAGPWALWQSRLRVQRAGLSAPYTPALQRRAVAPEVGAARLPASVLAQPLPQAEGSSLE